MKAFKVKGRFLMGDRWQDFTKEIAGQDDAQVKEAVYSRLGSKHRVKRPKIEIFQVTEIPLEEVTDPITSYVIRNEDEIKAIKKEKAAEPIKRKEKPKPIRRKRIKRLVKKGEEGKIVKKEKVTKSRKKKMVKKGEKNE